MKSLDQVASTGVALNVTNTPGDASNHFIINQPGSYFLTGNLDVTKTNGIRVNVPGATINLNGFQIARASGTGGDGITIRPEGHRCTVVNGSVSGFATGIDTITTTARGCIFRDISAANCTNIAIRTGEGAILDGCRVHDNSGAAGILTGPGATLTNCSAVGNSATNAIQTGTASILTNCTASSNTGTNGISVDDGSALSNCAASSNTLTGISGGIVAAESCALTNCAASSNAAQYGLNTGLGAMLLNCSATNNNPARYGIFVGPGGSLTNGASYSNVVSQGINPAAIGASSGAVVVDSTAGSNNAGGSSAYDKGVGFFLGGLSIVQQCNARSNTGAGILLGVSRSIARANNVVANNPSSGLPSGISLLPNSSFNRIEGNNVTDNEIVQILTDSHSIVITNTLSGDIYVIDSGNSLGAIIDDTGGGGAAVNGSSASATFGSPNAWANITY